MTTIRSIQLVRNIGIVAHVDAGKTTLTERILFGTGALRVMGEVHEGTTATDTDPLEQRKGITINAAAVSCSWRNHRIQLIDTPGHADFTLEVARSLRVLDGAVVVLDAVAGVEAQTETVWHQADLHALPRVCFVNKLDRPGADFARSVDEIGSRLGARPAVIGLPIGAGADFAGVVDLVRMRAVVWDADRTSSDSIPVPMRDEAKRWRERLVEACADVDTTVAEQWLATGDVGADELVQGLRRATIARSLVPTLCGSAYENRGVPALLDAVVDFLPAPDERAPARSVDGLEERAPDPTAPFSALCFKVVHDDFSQLAFVRIYSGVLRSGTRVMNARTGREIRVPRLVRVFAAQREDIAAASAGDVAAILGASLRTGDTLSDPDHPIVLEPIGVPAAVVRVAIAPRSRADEDRLGIALGRLTVEDPSLVVSHDAETGQTVLAGMGELHLEVAIERMRTNHRVEVRAGRPAVAYRETLGRSVEHEVRHVKQTGGPGQYAHVRIRFAPAARGAGLVFEDATRGGKIPQMYVPSVRDGIADAMSTGVIAGYPVVDVCATLLDGSFHPKDSSDLAFRVAGARALREAAARAAPLLLEPVMRLEITLPSEAVGDAIGDLAARRGRVSGVSQDGPRCVVHARVPLAETFGYAGALGALSHGRGRHTMELCAYEPAPDAVLASLRRA